jgi:hypothetical protein
MTDKPTKRRKELAAKMDVSRRTAANFISARSGRKPEATTEDEAPNLPSLFDDLWQAFSRADARSQHDIGLALLDARHELDKSQDAYQASVWQSKRMLNATDPKVVAHFDVRGRLDKATGTMPFYGMSPDGSTLFESRALDLATYRTEVERLTDLIAPIVRAAIKGAPSAGDGGSGGEIPTTKYVHVEYGTPYGTIWMLSDDPDGAVLSIPVPNGMVSERDRTSAFHRAVCPLIIETSSDAGQTWVHHPDEAPRSEWQSGLALMYELLVHGRSWNTARIRARTGEVLVRHPSQLLQSVADAIRSRVPNGDVTIQPLMHQLIVRIGDRAFAMAPPMRRPNQWPVYVTPIPPPSDRSGSWECRTLDEVTSTLSWPKTQPKVRVASLDEVRASG